jgi:hypothetical protein
VQYARIIFAAALLALPFAPVRADDDTAIFTAKTQYVEVDVRIDNRLKAFPRLYELLFAEGKKFGVESKEETAAQWRDHKSVFRGLAYSFNRVYRLRAAAGKYISVIMDESQFTGGAHPNHGSTTILWDRERKIRTDFKTLFKGTADGSADMQALSKLVLDALAAEKKSRDIPFDMSNMWFKDWKPEFKMFGEPSLAPSTEAGKSSGVTFHFSPYEVGAYAEGDYVAFVPASALVPLLTPEAQRLFGDARPKEDSDQN